MELRKYRRKPDQYVIAIALELETEGLSYVKWGGPQRAKRGDYLVENDGEVYTVEREVFLRTYRRVAPGHYVKTTPVWAAPAATAGSVPTREGVTQYQPHDYVVSNDRAGTDRYAVAREKFEAMYELDLSE